MACRVVAGFPAVDQQWNHVQYAQHAQMIIGQIVRSNRNLHMIMEIVIIHSESTRTSTVRPRRVDAWVARIVNAIKPRPRPAHQGFAGDTLTT
jgi:hypothetical protein